mmetsp:Transcript_37036/g.98458  ORF Transcript_37036/g.98458 Transcript_37036/m.98458 type:complete len:138 (+) Transcript_37036:689-1102(+)
MEKQRRRQPNSAAPTPRVRPQSLVEIPRPVCGIENENASDLIPVESKEGKQSKQKNKHPSFATHVLKSKYAVHWTKIRIQFQLLSLINDGFFSNEDVDYNDVDYNVKMLLAAAQDTLPVDQMAGFRESVQKLLGNEM